MIGSCAFALYVRSSQRWTISELGASALRHFVVRGPTRLRLPGVDRDALLASRRAADAAILHLASEFGIAPSPPPTVDSCSCSGSRSGGSYVASSVRAPSPGRRRRWKPSPHEKPAKQKRAKRNINGTTQHSIPPSARNAAQAAPGVANSSMCFQCDSSHAISILLTDLPASRSLRSFARYLDAAVQYTRSASAWRGQAREARRKQAQRHAPRTVQDTRGGAQTAQRDTTCTWRAGNSRRTGPLQRCLFSRARWCERNTTRRRLSRTQAREEDAVQAAVVEQQPLGGGRGCNRRHTASERRRQPLAKAAVAGSAPSLRGRHLWRCLERRRLNSFAHRKGRAFPAAAPSGRHRWEATAGARTARGRRLLRQAPPELWRLLGRCAPPPRGEPRRPRPRCSCGFSSLRASGRGAAAGAPVLLCGGAEFQLQGNVHHVPRAARGGALEHHAIA